MNEYWDYLWFSLVQAQQSCKFGVFVLLQQSKRCDNKND